MNKEKGECIFIHSFFLLKLDFLLNLWYNDITKRIKEKILEWEEKIGRLEVMTQ